MLPPPALPLAGQAGLAQNAWVGSTVFLLSGRDWPRYLLGCSLDPLSTTPFQLFTVPGGATGSFDAQRNGLAQLSANVVLLDRILAHYGPESKEAREQLRGATANLIKRTWPADGSRPGQLEAPGGYESLYETIQALAPKNEAQRSLKAAAIKTGVDIAHARWLLFAEKGSSIPVPFLV